MKIASWIECSLSTLAIAWIEINWTQRVLLHGFGAIEVKYISVTESISFGWYDDTINCSGQSRIHFHIGSFLF